MKKKNGHLVVSTRGWVLKRLCSERLNPWPLEAEDRKGWRDGCSVTAEEPRSCVSVYAVSQGSIKGNSHNVYLKERTNEGMNKNCFECFQYRKMTSV